MRTKRFKVELTDEEQTELMLLIRRGTAPARRVRRAHILLRASEGAFDHDTAAALHVAENTGQALRRRFAAAPAGERLGAALYDVVRPTPAGLRAQAGRKGRGAPHRLGL